MRRCRSDGDHLWFHLGKKGPVTLRIGWRPRIAVYVDGREVFRPEKPAKQVKPERETVDLPDLEFPETTPYSRAQSVQAEFEALGLSATAHPLEFFEEWLKEKRLSRLDGGDDMCVSR